MKKYFPSFKIISKKHPSIRTLTDGHPKLFLFAAFICVIIIGLLDRLYNPEFIDILVEAHGLLFDIILFGVLLSIYDTLTQRKNRIRHYLEEIEDFQGWNQPEATYKIVGNIKRLNREEVYSFDLSHTHLRDANLYDIKLISTPFNSADLTCTMFAFCDLEDSSFHSTHLHFTHFESCNLKGVSFKTSIFKGTTFDNCNLRGAKFSEIVILNEPEHFPRIFNSRAYYSQKKTLEFMGIDTSTVVWDDDPF